MNRIFNIIWSKSKERWIVVSEKTKSNGKVPKSLLLSFAFLSSMIVAGVPLYALDPGALPTGGQITSGNATIATSDSQMTVDQSSQSMIANWQSFNIGADAGVRFNQPNSSSTALNRINDQNPTQIMGSLSANGKLFLINPSGIIFGRDARVDVGGLVASSLDMLDHDFLEGKYNFRNPGNAGTILNQGKINAFQGGVVALIAPKATNEGTITTPGGSTALGAGNQVSLDFNGDGLISLTVDAGAVEALAENKGLIKAEGGLVMMTAKAADTLIQSAVNNSGIIEANSFQQRAGRIILDAAEGMTTISGTLDASSSESKGGQIVATGERALVTSGGHLTASGATGGGEVLVGGSWQGKDSSIPQATGTIIEPGARLEANATDNGNGGTVVAWSDVTNPLSVTRAYGTFEAQGGPNGGDGGRIETSGHWIDVEGSQGGASAPMGEGGLWLFDPWDVTISSTTSTGGEWSVAAPFTWTPTGTPTGTSTILNTDIDSKLGSNVTITTTGSGGDFGDITVLSPIAKTSGSNTRTLTLTADGSITIKAEIGNSIGTLNLTMNANGGTISGDTNGNISVNGKTTFNVGSGSGTFQGVISKTSSLTKSGAGTLILSGANSYTGTTTISKGALRAAHSTALGTTAGGVTVASGAALELEGDITIDAETLSLSGSGISTGGALRNISGNNSYGGLITLSVATHINSDSGVLTLDVASGDAISATNKNITFGGSGNITVADPIATGTGTLIKTGAGTLTLSGVNSYTGKTTISDGTLAYGANNTLATGAVTVNGDTAVLAIGTWSESVGAVTLTNGSITGSTGVLTGTSYTVNNPTGTTTTISAILGGTGGLTKSNAGTLILSGENSYTGATVINTGTLMLGAAGGTTNTPLGTMDAGTTVTFDATLDLNGFSLGTAEALTLNGTGFGGAGALTNSSPTAATCKGLITLGSGSSIIANSGELTLDVASGDAISATNRNITFGGSGNITVADPIATGTGTLTKTGSGTLTLSGANSYIGRTTISDGTLAYGANNTLATGAVTVNGAAAVLALGIWTDSVGAVTLTDGSITGTGTGTLTSTSGFSVFNGTISAILDGSAGLTKSGDGTVTLSGANTYTGVTTINAGTLSVATINNGGTSGNLGAASKAPAKLVLGGGTLQYTGATASTNRSFTLTNGTTSTIDVTANNLTILGAGANTTGALTKTGAGTLTFSGANSYTGLTTISGGTLAYGANNALSTGAVTLNDASAVLALGTWTDSVGAVTLTDGSITGTGTGTLTSTSGFSVVNGTISAILDGSVGFSKSGDGMVTLSGANTYTGITTISGGTLRAANSTALGTNALGTIVNSGATLELVGGIEIVNENLTLSGSGFASGGALCNVSGNNSYGGPVTLSGATRINSASGILTLNSSINGSHALNINGSGSVILGGALGNTGVLDSFTGDEATTLFVNGSSVKTVGTQTYSGSTTFDVPTTLMTMNRDISATGRVTAIPGKLTLASGSGNVMFSNILNDLSIVQVNGAGNVSIVNADALNVSGITATGPINVATLTGNLTISGPVTTTNATPSAIIFNAGQNAAAGTASGGNIIIAGTPTIAAGPGGIAAFYTGSISESPGLTNLIGTGSGNFRYNSDESTTNFTTPLSAGLNAIYREQPTITVTGYSDPITYGENPTLATISIGFQNGDTPEQTFSGNAIINVEGIPSSSNHYTAGEHTLTPSGLTSLLGYAISYSTDGTLTVGKKALTVSGITSDSKTYDGNTDATVQTGGATFDDMVSGDDLSFSSVTGEFDDKNVGTDKPVTLTSSYGGADKDNYDITDQTEAYADITAKPLTLTGLTAENKVYDGNTDATISSYGTLTGVIGTETVGLDTGSSASAAFDNKNVGTGKSVTVSSLNLTGGDSSNYSIENQTTTANITARALALTLIGLTADNKVYDGNTDATISSYGILNGVLGSDAVALDTGSASASFDNKNVGTGKTVTVSNLNLSGGNSGNYSIANQTTTADITAKPLTLTGLTANNKVYDGNKTATISNYGSLTGVIGSDAVDLATGSTLAEFDTKNAGTGKTVTVSTLNLSGSDRGNYRIANQTTTTANITAKPLTISGLTAYDKNYDGYTNATINPSGVVFVGWISPDDLYLSATGQFSDPDIGTSKVVTLTTTYGGIDRNNYTITDQATATASILTAGTLTSELPPVPLPPPVILGVVQPPLIVSALGLIVEYVAPPVNPNAGVIVVAVPQAVLTFGTNFTIPLPEEVQKVIIERGDPEVVTLDGGSPLPKWLQYDSTAKIFKVNAPPAEQLPVKLVLRIGKISWTMEITT